jgi:hypothetical protein
LLSSLPRSTKERARHPPPSKLEMIASRTRSNPILQVQLYKSNFTSPILQVQFHKSNFTSPISQVQFHKSNFTSPILQVQLYKSNFTSPILQVNFYKSNFTSQFLIVQLYKYNFTSPILQKQLELAPARTPPARLHSSRTPAQSRAIVNISERAGTFAKLILQFFNFLQSTIVFTIDN